MRTLQRLFIEEMQAKEDDKFVMNGTTYSKILMLREYDEDNYKRMFRDFADKLKKQSKEMNASAYRIYLNGEGHRTATDKVFSSYEEADKFLLDYVAAASHRSYNDYDVLAE